RESCLEDFDVIHFKVGAETVELDSHLASLYADAIEAVCVTSGTAAVPAVVGPYCVLAICCADIGSSAAFTVNDSISGASYEVLRYETSVFDFAAEANDISCLQPNSFPISYFNASGHYIGTGFTGKGDSVCRRVRVSRHTQTVSGYRLKIRG